MSCAATGPVSLVGVDKLYTASVTTMASSARLTSQRRAWTRQCRGGRTPGATGGAAVLRAGPSGGSVGTLGQRAQAPPAQPDHHATATKPSGSRSKTLGNAGLAARQCRRGRARCTGTPSHAGCRQRDSQPNSGLPRSRLPPPPRQVRQESPLPDITTRRASLIANATASAR